jgi:hypothetical protein
MSDARRDAFKHLGIISRSFERFFFCAQYISVSFWLLQSRADAINASTGGASFDLDTLRRRSRAIERYLVIWFLVEASLFIALNRIPCNWRAAAVVPAVYRAFEIFQTVINVNLLDAFSLRQPGRNYVASLARMIILSLWNYMEIVICFAIYYASNIAHFNVSPHGESIGRSAALYFSAVTQLTIGYGDIAPTELTRLVATLQGLTAFVIALFAVGRIVNLLPEFIAVPDKKSEDKTS